MTMDRTLKQHGGLIRTRSVLTRAERIRRLMEEEKFDPQSGSPFGLPKTRVRHSKAGTKVKKEAREPEAAEVGAEGQPAGETAGEGA
jgi:small basic protein (TIGR04137 family)